MAHTSFKQDIFIATSSEKVTDFLVGLNNHSQIHPLIVKVEQTASSTAEDGTEIKHYKIRDRMKQGPFTIAFTYDVTIGINTQGEIVSDAYQKPGIHLHNITRCLPEGNGTRVTEYVEITAPRLLIQTVFKQGLASHKEMFANLKKVLENIDA